MPCSWFTMEQHNAAHTIPTKAITPIIIKTRTKNPPSTPTNCMWLSLPIFLVFLLALLVPYICLRGVPTFVPIPRSLSHLLSLLDTSAFNVADQVKTLPNTCPYEYPCPVSSRQSLKKVLREVGVDSSHTCANTSPFTGPRLSRVYGRLPVPLSCSK